MRTSERQHVRACILNRINLCHFFFLCSDSQSYMDVWTRIDTKNSSGCCGVIEKLCHFFLFTSISIQHVRVFELLEIILCTHKCYIYVGKYSMIFPIETTTVTVSSYLECVHSKMWLLFCVCARTFT